MVQAEVQAGVQATRSQAKDDRDSGKIMRLANTKIKLYHEGTKNHLWSFVKHTKSGSRDRQVRGGAQVTVLLNFIDNTPDYQEFNSVSKNKPNERQKKLIKSGRNLKV